MRLFTVAAVFVASLLALLDDVQSSTPDFKQPDAYAVVIGISQYREEVIPKVAYAVKDAEAVAKLLEAQAGIPKTHIRLLTDAKATGNDLRTVGEWLRMRVKPESTVYVYYAGHGTPDPKTGDAYLVPWDGHPDFPSGLYPLNALYESLNKLPAKHVIVMLDSCFSGATGRSVLAKGARPMVLSLENPLLAAGKVMVLAASTGNQISSDYDKAGHGLFTYALLTGLQGGADQDKDGLVTVRELYPYVRKQVAETAVEELNREQTPVLLPGEELLGARAALPVALVAPGSPAKPSAPALVLPPVKDVDVSGYDQLDQVEKLAEKREQAWAKVQHFAGQKHVKRDTRLAMLDKFLADFSDDNPHAGEVEALKQRVNAELQVASVPSYSTPKEAGREITGRDGAPMALVPAGEFLYGDNNQRLSLPAFYMDKFEVTTKLYAAFMQATGRAAPGRWNEVSQVSDGDRPVIGVTWHDADAYCRYYGKRLPTEQEWEKAARGTDGRKYPWGNEEPTSRHANYGKCCVWKGYGATLASVESYEAGKSPYGIYNLAGNVWEWTSSDEGSSKVVRGGSWGIDADWLPASVRYGDTPADGSLDNGFRCVRDAR